MGAQYRSMNGKQVLENQAGGERLRAARMRHAWSQRDLEERSQVPQSAIHQYETACRHMRSQHGWKLAGALSLSPEDFNALMGYEVLPVPPQKEEDVIELRPGDLRRPPEPKEDRPMDKMPDPQEPKRPEMPSFDLNQFIRAYQDMQEQLRRLNAKIVELELVPTDDGSMTVPERAVAALEELEANRQFLGAALKEARQKSTGADTLRTLRDLIDGELKKLEV